MKKPEQFRHITTYLQWEKISDKILAEVNRAERQFPDWPVEIAKGLDIVLEEAGEVAKANVDYTWGRTDKSNIKEELVQTAAMCVRMLAAMEPRSN